MNKAKIAIVFIQGFLVSTLYFVWSKGKVVASKKTLTCLVQVREIPLPRHDLFGLAIPVFSEAFYLIEARRSDSETSTFRIYPSSETMKPIQIIELSAPDRDRFNVIFEGGDKIEVGFGFDDNSLIEWRIGTGD